MAFWHLLLLYCPLLTVSLESSRVVPEFKDASSLPESHAKFTFAFAEFCFCRTDRSLHRHVRPLIAYNTARPNASTL
jgi:hypothetical protein